MKEIVDLLNQIGDYYCLVSEEEIHIVGALHREKTNIVLQAQMELDHYRKLNGLYDELHFWGTINGTAVTLMSVHISRASSTYGVDTVSITLDPNEIIIGRCYKEEPHVTNICSSITALNYMCSQRPLEVTYVFSKDKPYLLKYTYPEKIEADDKYGHLVLFQTFSQGWTQHEIKHSVVPVIEYQFSKAICLMEAVRRIAAVRNLFSFFANGYLPLENIKFADEKSQRIDAQFLCDIALFLNHPEDITPRDDPFVIMTSDFKDSFSRLWQRWLEVYEGAAPIPALFYEVICNRSTRVNRFLNLSQALEVYSDQYRKSEAEQLAKKYDNPKPGKRFDVRLKYKIEDIFCFFNDCFEIAERDIPTIAQGIANMRNYYTHYNTGRYVEPTYQELFSAIHALHFVLLAIMYKTIGIDSKTITNTRNRSEFQLFSERVDNLLKYSSKKPNGTTA